MHPCVVLTLAYSCVFLEEQPLFLRPFLSHNRVIKFLVNPYYFLAEIKLIKAMTCSIIFQRNGSLVEIIHIKKLATTFNASDTVLYQNVMDLKCIICPIPQCNVKLLCGYHNVLIHRSFLNYQSISVHQF